MALAKEVAAELRGERPVVAKNAFCKIGWPECSCSTCLACYRVSLRDTGKPDGEVVR